MGETHQCSLEIPSQSKPLTSLVITSGQGFDYDSASQALCIVHMGGCWYTFLFLTVIRAGVVLALLCRLLQLNRTFKKIFLRFENDWGGGGTAGATKSYLPGRKVHFILSWSLIYSFLKCSFLVFTILIRFNNVKIFFL